MTSHINEAVHHHPISVILILQIAAWHTRMRVSAAPHVSLTHHLSGAIIFQLRLWTGIWKVASTTEARRSQIVFMN